MGLFNRVKKAPAGSSLSLLLFSMCPPAVDRKFLFPAELADFAESSIILGNPNGRYEFAEGIASDSFLRIKAVTNGSADSASSAGNKKSRAPKATGKHIKQKGPEGPF